MDLFKYFDVDLALNRIYKTFFTCDYKQYVMPNMNEMNTVSIIQGIIVARVEIAKGKQGIDLT